MAQEMEPTEETGIVDDCTPPQKRPCDHPGSEVDEMEPTKEMTIVDDCTPPPKRPCLHPDSDEMENRLCNKTMMNDCTPPPSKRPCLHPDSHETENRLCNKTIINDCIPPAKRPCRRPDSGEMENRLCNKKLVLILDLNHTLVESKSGKYLSPNELHLLNHPDLNIPLCRQSSLFTWIPTSLMTFTKLRPSAQAFLRQASSLFDMYVYTEASRRDALCITKLLDSDQLYFRNRIISSEDCSQQGKKGLDVVPHDRRFVVIVDDKEEMWLNDKDNLIQIAKYQYFSLPSDSGPAKSFSESKIDDDETGGVLEGVLEVLTRAHRAFFDDPQLPCRDIRVVLREMKQQVLKGCKIVFDKQLHLLVSQGKAIGTMAQEMGAICCNMDSVDASVTHVVSKSLNSKPACWALKNKKFLVTPLWIESAYYSWRLQKEGDFQIDALTPDQSNVTKLEQMDEKKSLKEQKTVKERKPSKCTGYENEKDRSLHRDISEIKEELLKAKTERDEARKGSFALTDIVTQLCAQVSYLTDLCEARPSLH